MRLTTAIKKKLAETKGPDGTFHAARIAEAASGHIPELRNAPEAGWPKYCFEVLLSRLYPEAAEIKEDPKYREGFSAFLTLLKEAYRMEAAGRRFDPTRDLFPVTEEEAVGSGVAEEFRTLRKVAEEMNLSVLYRLSADVTPFNTMGHMYGVHYVSMYVARQLKKAGVPVDLPLISGAAIGHDIGKFGCRKDEARRVPYLHYYYSDVFYREHGMPTIGHIAANHSTWDLELENLSAESLILIYADFRVKSGRDEAGREVVHFYSLAEAFDVILGKLDNVDAAKEARYRKVYAKLKNFEDYMVERGVETAMPADWAEAFPEPQPVVRNRALLEGKDVVDQLKYMSIAHNIRLMSVLQVDSDLADLIEAARSENQWKNLRTYIAIFEEYNTYMTQPQKLMSLQFLYELLANREGDIRRQSARLMGRIIAGFNEKYLKELPEGVHLPKREVTDQTLCREYIEKILSPERRFTEQHRQRMRYTLTSLFAGMFEQATAAQKKGFIDALRPYYEAPQEDQELTVVLLWVLEHLERKACDGKFLAAAEGFLEQAESSGIKEQRVAALRVRRNMLGEVDENTYYENLLEILGLPSDADAFLETESTLFLDNLKLSTHWMIKVANVELMKRFTGGRADHSHDLHFGTHLVNLLKNSERVAVRQTAGDALLELVKAMPSAQANEVAVELYNGLTIGDRQLVKYVPQYLGRMILELPEAEVEEMIDTLESEIFTLDTRVAASMVATIGVMLEYYEGFAARHPEAGKAFHEKRKLRLLYIMIKAYSHFDSDLSRDVLADLTRAVFVSKNLSSADRKFLFLHCYKKLFMLFDETVEDALGFYGHAAALNHIYRYIAHYENHHGQFPFPVRKKVCFYPGTFDPFSLGHKAVAVMIRDMGFDVYLALDEFSWSKHTQPKLLRRRIMNMAVAGEEGIYAFPDDIPVNIANNDDIRVLKSLFKDKELYIAVGTDVIENASAYAKEPEEDSIHSLNHITFERETRENAKPFHDGKSYPVKGKVIRLTLGKFYEDISSTRIRENIDLNRDISYLIDPVAQNFIYENNMYLREPTYKHVLESREIGIEPFRARNGESLAPIRGELAAMGYDLGRLERYLDGDKARTLYISDTSGAPKTIAYAACHMVGTRQLLAEFGDTATASVVRDRAEGAVAAIGFLYARDTAHISHAGQMLLTEILTELIARDCSYAVYNPVDPAGYDPQILKSLARQGFVDIAPEGAAHPLYAVSMRSPVVIFKDVETVIKAPLNKNPRVIKAIDEAHDALLARMAEIYPGKLLLSFNTGAIQNKIIAKVAALNGVSTIEGESKKGPYMAVPFGKALGDVLVPNTVTKALVVEKYFNRNIKGFTIAEAKNSSPLHTQARMIRSFGRPVILIDDLLHKSHRMNKLGPILAEEGVEIKKVMIGVMTANAMDRMTMSNLETESAYFLPTLEIWLNERDCYPFIGGDSLEVSEGHIGYKRGSSANLVLPYIKPGFIAGGDERAVYDYSETCLENARHIMKTLEEEYQKTFARKLTLARLGEVITTPRIPEMDYGVRFDGTLEPSNFIDNDIERLIRLKWGF